MTHDVDRLTNELREYATRLNNADLPVLSNAVREARDRLDLLALQVLGARRRYRATIGYAGKDWLGEPYRSDVMIRALTVDFLSRSTDPKELAAEALHVTYTYGQLFQVREEWSVVDLQRMGEA